MILLLFFLKRLAISTPTLSDIYQNIIPSIDMELIQSFLITLQFLMFPLIIIGNMQPWELPQFVPHRFQPR